MSKIEYIIEVSKIAMFQFRKDPENAVIDMFAEEVIDKVFLALPAFIRLYRAVKEEHGEGGYNCPICNAMEELEK